MDRLHQRLHIRHQPFGKRHPSQQRQNQRSRHGVKGFAPIHRHDRQIAVLRKGLVLWLARFLLEQSNGNEDVCDSSRWKESALFRRHHAIDVADDFHADCFRHDFAGYVEQ